MKFKKTKYITELRECKKVYDRLCKIANDYDEKCDEYLNKTDIRLPELEECFYPFDFCKYILFRIIHKDFHLQEEQYKEICFDCIRMIAGIECDAAIEREYKQAFWYDEFGDEPFYPSYFEGELEAEIDDSTGEMWKILFYNSYFLKEDNNEEINIILLAVNEFFIAMGEYLSKKLDDDVFKYATRYYFLRMKIRIEQYLKKLGEMFSDAYRKGGADRVIKQIGLDKLNPSYYNKEE